MEFLNQPKRYIFFTGKGGVGKTSLACAAAVRLADEGKKVLLVSTDPASNLDEVLETPLSSQPTLINNAKNVWAMNIDPEKAADAYRKRAIDPYRGVLPKESIQQMEEQLSGACTLEIASFDEFTGLLTEDHRWESYHHIIFDTAPTGHTLRLLQLPASWTNFLDSNPRDTSCLGPSSGLKNHRVQYAAAVKALSEPTKTDIVLVSRSEKISLLEAARTSRELMDLNIKNQQLVINGVFHAKNPDDLIAKAWEHRGLEALAQIPDELKTVPRSIVPLRGFNLVGIESIRALLTDSNSNMPQEIYNSDPVTNIPGLSQLADQMSEKGQGLIMVMGKGGVGKTTMASAIAVALASKGYSVHLSTTDPAAHLTETISEEFENLEISRIDPKVETERYKQHILETNGRNLNEDGRALLEEDLRSPCTEEIAVFHAFSKLISKARKQFVVLDTAPTGHTILLLDATGAYHRQVSRTMNQNISNITTPLMRLRDPDYTKVLIVSLPENTPVHEAQKLQEDLKRAEIEPYAWIMNRCLINTGTSDPILTQRAMAEKEMVREVQNDIANQVFLVPWQVEEPVGLKNLKYMVEKQEFAFKQ